MAPGLSSRVSVFTEEEGEEQTLIQQILLVDARAETRNALQSVFTEAGYDVFPADESEGVQTLDSALLPDVIVVHLHADDTPQAAGLPDMLRQDADLAETPVVVLKELKAERQAEWAKLVLAQIHNALHAVSSNGA